MHVRYANYVGDRHVPSPLSPPGICGLERPFTFGTAVFAISPGVAIVTLSCFFPIVFPTISAEARRRFWRC